MKKIFLAALILTQLAVFAPAYTYAQATNNSGSTDGYYDPANPSATPGGPGAAPADPVQTPVGIPGQIGVPANNPINKFNGNDTETQTQSQTGGTAVTAASCSEIKFKSVLDILIWLKCVAVAILIPLIFAAAFVVFLWGVLKFMYAADATKKKEGQVFIWWGLIGLFVMVSVWGIIKIAGTTLGIDPIAVPLLQTDSLNIKNANKTP